jgi:putative copper export protein
VEWVFARWLSFAATLVLVGVCVIGALTRRSAIAAPLRQIAPELGRIAWWASLMLLPASALRLLDQTLALQGPDDGVLTGLQPLLTSTTWGHGFLWQMAALLLALAGSHALRSRPASAWAWGAVAVGAVGLSVTPSLQGHAIGDELRPALAVVADASHVLAAGVWLGSIAVIGWLGIAVPTADGAVTADMTARATARLRVLVPLIPPVALAGAGALVVTGVAGSAMHLQRVADLWTSDWGRYVLVKSGLLAIVALLGALNWRRFGPRLDTAAGVRGLRRTLLSELVVALLALVVTAILVVTPLPGE